MATTSRQLADAVCALIGAEPGAGMHLARTFRQAGLGQWATPGRGRRDVAPEAEHMVNFVMGLGTGDPVNAPALVARLGDLRTDEVHLTSLDTDLREHESAQQLDWRSSDTVYVAGMPIAQTLVRTLAGLVELAARFRSPRPMLQFQVDLDYDQRRPEANIRITDGPRRYRVGFRPKQAELLEAAAEDEYLPPVTRTVTFWPNLFVGLAAIWKDTLAIEEEPGIPPSAAPLEASLSPAVPANTAPEDPKSSGESERAGGTAIPPTPAKAKHFRGSGRDSINPNRARRQTPATVWTEEPRRQSPGQTPTPEDTVRRRARQEFDSRPVPWTTNCHGKPRNVVEPYVRRPGAAKPRPGAFAAS